MIVNELPYHVEVEGPVIASMPRAQAPQIPAGLVYRTVAGPDTLVLAHDAPVLQFAGCTYWVFGWRDNREAMAIIAYTADGVERQRWDRPMARNLWWITSHAASRTVTFHGQRRAETGRPGTITMGWNDLVPDPPRLMGRLAQRMPLVPDGLIYATTYGPDSQELNPHCPVLRFGEHTYWPFSHLGERNAMGIVAYDRAGNPVRRWDREGARSVWKIIVDEIERTVTFYGQRLPRAGRPGSITLSWDELWIG